MCVYSYTPAKLANLFTNKRLRTDRKTLRRPESGCLSVMNRLSKRMENIIFV